MPDERTYDPTDKASVARYEKDLAMSDPRRGGASGNTGSRGSTGDDSSGDDRRSDDDADDYRGSANDD